jgi:hypothetical protein
MVFRLSGFLLLATAGAAVAGELEPTLSVGLIRTDNVTLVPVNPESATVLLVSPGLTYTQDSDKLTADVAYRFEAYHYQQRDMNRYFNLFDADLELGLVPDRFFLDFGGSRSQAIINPEGTIPFDNLAISTNLVDRDDLFLGPSFQVPVGENVLVNGNLRRTWVQYADSLPALGRLPDYETDEAGLSVDNYRKGVGVSWAARYVYQKAGYDEPLAPFYYRQAYAELGFWVTQGTRLFVVGGLESPWDAPLESGLEDSFVEAGVVRDFGEQFRAEVAVGERSFGKSGRVDLEYNFSRGSTTFRYSDTPTTNANDRFTYGGLLERDEPNDYLFRAGSAQRYISRLFQWSVDLDFDRYDFAFALFDESRDARTAVNGVPLPDEAQWGGDLSVSWRLGSRAQLYLSAMRASREFASGEESDLSADTVGVSYAFLSRVLLSLELERREQTSLQTALRNYRADLASLTVSWTF